MLQDYKAKSLQSTDKWLKNTDKLKAFYIKQQKEQKLTSIICEETGIELEHFYVASSNSKVLILQTNNGVVATQLRLASNRLVNKISQSPEWRNSFDSLKVNVRPLYHKQRSRQPSMREISPENAQLLEEVAEYSQNPKLKEVLLRIAKHRRNKN